MATFTSAADDSSAVSWGAIFAGAAISLAVTLVIVTFAIGAGLSVVSPWSCEGVSSTAAARTAGLLLIAVAMLSSTVGGFVAGRLRPIWSDVHEDERYFRDTAHGLTAWAVATLISVAILGSATTKVVSGVASGAASATSTVASPANSNGYIDRLLRSNPAQASTTGQSNQGNDAASRADFTRVFSTALTPNSQLAPEDHTYLGSVVASRAGISQAEAEQRVDQSITEAKQAADTARKSAAKLSFWVAASLLAGALAAMLAATVGGWLRSSTWWEPARPALVTATTRKR
jgi:hypothetical protein